MDARQTYSSLGEPWQACLDEAWASWARGSAGVGAVITDAVGSIVARGRNRMLEQPTEPGMLAGTSLAHAEMNALAQVPLGGGADWSLYTTFEPCLMCASTLLQTPIAHLHYAAADPVFDGLHDWFNDLPFAADRRPQRTCLGGPVGAFAHVLHLSWLAFWLSDDPIIDAHRRLKPHHLEVASHVVRDNRLADVAAAGGTAVDALGALWGDLQPIEG